MPLVTEYVSEMDPERLVWKFVSTVFRLDAGMQVGLSIRVLDAEDAIFHLPE